MTKYGHRRCNGCRREVLLSLQVLLRGQLLLLLLLLELHLLVYCRIRRLLDLLSRCGLIQPSKVDSAEYVLCRPVSRVGVAIRSRGRDTVCRRCNRVSCCFGRTCSGGCGSLRLLGMITRISQGDKCSRRVSRGMEVDQGSICKWRCGCWIGGISL